MSTLTVTVLTVALSPPWVGYVGLYADHEHCRAMQALIAEEQRQAVVVCQDVVLRGPVPVPPPRPEGLRSPRQPVLVPPMRPWG